MSAPGTRSDGLRLAIGGIDLISLRTVGALAGIVVVAAAARNGPGAGRLIASSAGLSWQAPGSSASGPPVSVPADGAYLLEDGADPSRWLRVQAYTAFLPADGEARVYLDDRYNELGPDDVSAAHAAAGITQTLAATLTNVSGNAITDVKVWVDPATAHVSISSDNVTFVTPASEVDAAALSYASIAPGASVNLWARRTIGAAAASNPRILNLLQWAWTGF